MFKIIQATENEVRLAKQNIKYNNKIKFNI